MATVVKTTPMIPTKWDIIPIHSSDRAAFKFCRRQWAWSSPSRSNLIPKAQVHGIRENLWFGTGIHYALERYYNPLLQEDPLTTFITWFNLEWNGGTVTKDDVHKYPDRNPMPLYATDEHAQMHEPTHYKIDGLRDLVPYVEETEEKIMNLFDIGKGMMEFYTEWAPKNDNFEVISTEHDFSVPVLKPDGRAMYAPDTRKMPDDWEPTNYENYYGKLMYKAGIYGATYKQVHVRGRMDMVCRDKESGKYGVLDYKTTGKLDDDYFRHMELDEQTTSYLSFGEQEGKLYGYPYEKLEFILYQAMLKAYPKPPSVTSRGLLSISRNDESTTAEMFEAAVNSNPAWRAIYDSKVEWQNYYTWLLELGDKRFVHRKMEWRNSIQRRNAFTRLYYEVQDMLGKPVLYPNPTKNYSCLNCVFRAPCIAAEDGSDYETILHDNYVPNWDR